MYIRNVLIAIDQLANTVLFGYPDETLSCRSYRLADRHWYWSIMRTIIDTLFFWQYDYTNNQGHCEQCYIYEKNRNDLPPEMRD